VDAEAQNAIVAECFRRGGAGREKESSFSGSSTAQVVETWFVENDFGRFFLTTAEALRSAQRTTMNVEPADLVS
jgi:hypothetical protein